MKFSDLFWLFFIFAFCLIMNGGQLFTMENLIKAGVGAVIVIGIIIVIYLDYSPIWKLKAAEIAFYEDMDMERTLKSVDDFKRRNKRPDKAFKGYLLESQLQLIQGEFTDAIDTLLYVEQKGLDVKEKLRVALMKCKVQMFMGTLVPDNPDYRFCWEKRTELFGYDLFNLILIRGWLQANSGKAESCQKSINRLKKFHEVPFIEKPLIDNEIRWIESILACSDNDEETYKKQFNLLKAMNCLPYLIKSYTRSH